jgi:D-lactate dehydrogenase (cytochrome)
LKSICQNRNLKTEKNNFKSFVNHMLSKNDQNTFQDYLEDSSSMAKGQADAVIFPQSEQEIIQIVKQANSDLTKITVSGAGTGVVGGRIPFGGIILATDRMKKIIQVNNPSSNPSAVVEPGVSINELNQYLKDFRLKYLPDPTEKNAYLGATVATNACGAQGYKYGPTRIHILGLHIVLPQGQLLCIRRGEHIIKKRLEINLKDNIDISCELPDFTVPQIKNAAGYHIGPGTDLVDLFIGQEGTLGVISRIELSLSELPSEILSAMIFFDVQEKALDFVKKLKERSNGISVKPGIDVACIEFFDACSLNILREKYSRIPKGSKTAIYFEQNIFDQDISLILDEYSELMQRSQIRDSQIWFAQNLKDRELIEKIRYDLPVMINEKVRLNGFSKISTDIAVSDDNFMEMFEFYDRNLRSCGIDHCIFGHIGENHLHVNLIPKTEEDYKKSKKLYLQLVNKAVDLNGTIAAEHGIGKLKRQYFKIMVGERVLKQMARIKKEFDPKLILNPGNIFDPEIFDQLEV